jgi:hypothetical protein
MKVKLSKLDKKLMKFCKKNNIDIDYEKEVLKSKANSYDEIFANPCKNQNRFTGNVILVNVEDLTEDFKNGKY